MLSENARARKSAHTRNGCAHTRTEYFHGPQPEMVVAQLLPGKAAAVGSLLQNNLQLNTIRETYLYDNGNAITRVEIESVYQHYSVKVFGVATTESAHLRGSSAVPKIQLERL